MFEYYELDVEDSEENLEFAKNTLGIRNIPSIRFFPHGTYRK